VSTPKVDSFATKMVASGKFLPFSVTFSLLQFAFPLKNQGVNPQVNSEIEIVSAWRPGDKKFH
jgi:hypothetical protein